MTDANRAKAIAREFEKARQALEDADVLLGESRSDATISRAYYAAFHAARAALLTLGVQPRTHKGVNERFNLDLVVPGQIEAEYLSALGRVQSRREAADYGIDASFTAEEARAERDAAARFVARVERFLEGGGWLAGAKETE